MLNGFRYFFTELLPQAKEYVSVPLVIGESVILGIVGLAAQLLQIFFAIIIGGQVAKKHRILAAIGMYLLINMGVGYGQLGVPLGVCRWASSWCP